MGIWSALGSHPPTAEDPKLSTAVYGPTGRPSSARDARARRRRHGGRASDGASMVCDLVRRSGRPRPGAGIAVGRAPDPARRRRPVPARASPSRCEMRRPRRCSRGLRSTPVAGPDHQTRDQIEPLLRARDDDNVIRRARDTARRADSRSPDIDGPGTVRLRTAFRTDPDQITCGQSNEEARARLGPRRVISSVRSAVRQGSSGLNRKRSMFA